MEAVAPNIAFDYAGGDIEAAGKAISAFLHRCGALSSEHSSGAHDLCAQGNEAGPVHSGHLVSREST